MAIPDYPPNNEASKKESKEKDIKQVTSGEVKRRKKPLRAKLSETLIGASPREAASHTVFEVLIPAAKDMVAEGLEDWVRSVMFGSNHRRGSATPPSSGPTGFVNYGARYAMGKTQGSAQRAMSRASRARHDFDEIILETRAEAERVIDDLLEVVSTYGTASVADLYAMVGISSTHVDKTWGWDDLRGAGVSRARGGYLVDLPAPSPLR